MMSKKPAVKKAPAKKAPAKKAESEYTIEHANCYHHYSLDKFGHPIRRIEMKPRGERSK